jgi:RNA polymerase sigma-70 factor (ECF subfamily)
MTHNEVAEFTGLPLGTVKSHIRRGTQKLQQELAAYLGSNEDST